MYFGKRKYSQLQEFTHFVPSNHLISHGFDSGKELTPGVVTPSRRVGVSRNHKNGESLQHQLSY